MDGLFWRHSNAAVEADHFAVQHLVLEDVSDERGIFLGATQPGRKRHLLRERLARGLRQPGEERRIERPRRNRHHAHTDASKLARDAGASWPTMPPFDAE